jgi:CBS domain-containing protein
MMIITVADIMTAPALSLAPGATLKDAHEITRKKGIRHLPVVDPDTNKLIAIVTQKALIAKVIALLTQFGSQDLESQEAKINIMDLAETDYDAVHETEAVTDIAEFFIGNRHGCLPVVSKDNQLIGIVTSSDFVKLSVRLLSR